MHGPISAVCCNHNTSKYMELMLRSFDATHADQCIDHWTLYDNASIDDTASVYAYAQSRGTPIQQSGYTTDTQHVSHGALLQRAITAFPDSLYVVLFDADIVFTQHHTIPRMITQLADDPQAWAIGVAPSWDGQTEVPPEARAANPDICDARLHPACAVIKNTPLFRTVLACVGMGTYVRHYPERDEYLDTCKLLTQVMLTHGMHHRVSSDILVKHFFCTSYEWDAADLRAAKMQTRDALLSAYR